ncbi:metallophosphoesterase [Kutzneria viridogrisea]|uniref:Metallophosphoesterase n=2 Tax=Kutzneria TaxID=43356 RepID=W5W4F5_9PSEU|nr:metallophosphoesterase [Kutzneria albida]AHH95356.1 metallophosphoesterase [Kutzneria albida DSM 43870]MBA8927287.1 Icc-related predicted phosphoesterase [Kutzneria viridogrisea]
MRVHVVSDVHGNSEALARAGEGADALFVLGDLLDFVDYHDYSGGIMGAVFGPENVARFAEYRKGRRNAEAVAFVRSLWAGLGGQAEVVREAVREQYKRLFSAMTAPTYATPGNVDDPSLWPEFAGAGVTVLDGQTTEVGGLRVGFVGGALLPPGAEVRRNGVWQPYLRFDEDMVDPLAALGEVDVLCTHVPPAVPELTYDVVARRPEIGSVALLETIRRTRPRWSLFGHVHQPLSRRVRLGSTECVNVGHFQRTGTPYVLRF